MNLPPRLRPCWSEDSLSVLVCVALPAVLFAVSIDSVKAAPQDQLKLPSADVPAQWQVKAEQTAFRATSRYNETIRFCRRLADASPWIEYRSFGKSAQGRELPLVIASKDQAFTPEAAKSTGKLIVFVQNCIHPGECAGKDASLMLLRDMVITKTRQELLDHVILLVIPIFNADGHERFGPYSRINQNGPEEMGWRVTSRNLDLNRDYVKADAAEMRAWLALWNAWRPDLHVDNHTTDGGDWQYDLMFTTGQHQAAAPQVADWLKDRLYPELLPALEADGHVTATYFSLVDRLDPAKGIRSGGFGPRYSTGYASIRNRPSFLVETHMLKTYRTRVICHYNLVLHVLESLNAAPELLRAAVKEADQVTARIGTTYDPDFKMPVAIGSTDESVPFVFKGYACRRELSEISGHIRIIYDNTKPIEIETVWFNGTKVTKVVSSPLGYIIPPQWKEVIELVKVHGLRSHRLLEPVTAEFESYRFEGVSFPTRPYEGRFEPRFTTVPITERRTYLPGSVIVPLDQPNAKVAIHMFEPEAPDSLVAWGFFNAIFEQREYAEHYIAEKLARDMLAADPKLHEEFKAKLRTDRDFASSPRARLYFFYKRSPYWDDHMNVYPIGRIIRRLSARTEPM